MKNIVRFIYFCVCYVQISRVMMKDVLNLNYFVDLSELCVGGRKNILINRTICKNIKDL